MTDKKLTPMMELIDDIDKLLTDPEIQKDPLKYKVINVVRNQAVQLKEKERQMVINAANNAYESFNIGEMSNKLRKQTIEGTYGEQYYTQTYKS